MKTVFGVMLIFVMQLFTFAEKSIAGVLFLAADANMNNSVDGSGGAPINAGNINFFLNVLGNQKRVLIHNRFVPQENGAGTTALSNLFNSISGVTSVTDYPGGEITTGLLSSVDLFIIRPRLAFSASEISAMDSFVKGSGTLYLIGENSSFNVAQDTVNSLLTGIGSLMQLENSNFAGGFNTTTNIAVNPFTSGVSSIVYNLTNSIAGGTPLVRSDAAFNSPVIVAYESFSAIPEPSAALLSGLCLCILAFRRVGLR